MLLKTGEILHASGLATQREYCLKVSKNRNSEIELEAMICIDDVAPGPKVVIPYGEQMCLKLKYNEIQQSTI